MDKDNWDKAAVIGQIINGVLLAAVALLIKTGADNIASSVKKGELVQSLISDLASQGEKNIRQDMALIALNHSLGDQEQGLIIEIAEQIVSQGEYEKLAGSVAYKILQQKAPAKANELQKRALEFTSSPSLREDLRSNANPAALTETPTPTPPNQVPDPGKQLIAKVLPNLVFIQIKNEQSRLLAESLRQELSKSGFVAPGIDRIDAGFSDSIRFFYEGDRLLAERVGEITKGFLNGQKLNMNVPLQNLSKGKFKAQPGQIEIWINL